MTIPYVFDNDVQSSDIFSKLLNSRIIFLDGEINDKLSNLIIAELLYLDSISNDDIYIYINSPGGSITSGMAIYDTMKYVKSGNKRYALPNTEIMIHEPLGGIQGQATEMKIVTDRILKIREKLNKILSKNTHQSLSKIKKDTERDYYMDSKEALSYGIIDKIIDS